MMHEETGVTIVLKEPRLSGEEKLYVKAYFSTISHPKAHAVLRPDAKQHPAKNMFSKSDAVQYHIKKGMISKMESLDLTGDKVLDLLLQEATRLGNGSSPTARVQALTLLGKQLGLFEEKKEEKEGVIFNIVNYSGDLPVTKIEKKEDEVVNSSLPSNIKIESFGDQ